MTTEARAHLLLELGCEELPPKSVDALRDALLSGVADGLENAGVAFDRSASQSYSTPRRLAILLCDVADRQPDQTLERRGPAVQAAFDSEGTPTQAAEGFARSVGMEVADLGRMKTDKGEWLHCEQHVTGKTLSEVIFEIVSSALRQLPVPRPMRWSDHEFSFVRPVHWVVLLHGDNVLEGQILGQDTGSQTRGHRIHAPGPHAIPTAEAYEDTLLAANVIADASKRRDHIVEALTSADPNVIIEPALLSEVNNLVEWPVVVRCGFDEEFLAVPHEALTASMQDHQKFFPIGSEDEGSGTAIRNEFLAISNIDSTNVETVRTGYERVIRPRLADARFFLQQDEKQPLEAFRPLLNDVVFQSKVGSVGDKSDRITFISRHLADVMGTDPDVTERAAQLCKCDLMTQMVGEFPELQGTMGAHYASTSGEPITVARAIGEHYLPRFAGDTIPGSPEGRIVAISDKADTLVSIFAAGLKPTGNKDPYALRRAALGLIRILSEAGIPVHPRKLFEWALQSLESTIDCAPELLGEVLDFVLQRARGHYKESGFSAELVAAVLLSPWSDIPDLDARIVALKDFMGHEEASSLATANKRIGNILRKSETSEFGSVDEKYLVLDEEKQLFEEVSAVNQQLRPLLENSDYSASLSHLATLKGAVDRFFDTVLVMDEDEVVRNNRLALLFMLKGSFDDIADLSVLG